MLRDCSYCFETSDCVLVEMISWICPKCFVKFYEYWTSRSLDFLGLYVDFKLRENYKSVNDVINDAGKQIERAKIMAMKENIPVWLSTQKPLSFKHKY